MLRVLKEKIEIGEWFAMRLNIKETMMTESSHLKKFWASGSCSRKTASTCSYFVIMPWFAAEQDASHTVVHHALEQTRYGSCFTPNVQATIPFLFLHQPTSLFVSEHGTSAGLSKNSSQMKKKEIAVATRTADLVNPLVFKTSRYYLANSPANPGSLLVPPVVASSS